MDLPLRSLLQTASSSRAIPLEAKNRKRMITMGSQQDGLLLLVLENKKTTIVLIS